jgi:hypothetical protein
VLSTLNLVLTTSAAPQHYGEIGSDHRSGWRSLSGRWRFLNHSVYGPSGHLRGTRPKRPRIGSALVWDPSVLVIVLSLFAQGIDAKSRPRCDCDHKNAVSITRGRAGNAAPAARLSTRRRLALRHWRGRWCVWAGRAGERAGGFPGASPCNVQGSGARGNGRRTLGFNDHSLADGDCNGNRPMTAKRAGCFCAASSA